MIDRVLQEGLGWLTWGTGGTRMVDRVSTAEIESGVFSD